MKRIKELNTNKVPIVQIDDRLEQYKSAPIFQEKLEKANQVLTNIPLPKPKLK